MSNQVQATSGIGFPSLLFLVFLTLKLTGHIDWSWWWVTAPLWIPFAIFIGTIVIVVTFSAIANRK